MPPAIITKEGINENFEPNRRALRFVRWQNLQQTQSVILNNNEAGRSLAPLRQEKSEQRLISIQDDRFWQASEALRVQFQLPRNWPAVNY